MINLSSFIIGDHSNYRHFQVFDTPAASLRVRRWISLKRENLVVWKLTNAAETNSELEGFCQPHSFRGYGGCTRPESHSPIVGFGARRSRQERRIKRSLSFR